MKAAISISIMAALPLIAFVAIPSSASEVLRSYVDFNLSIGKKTANQPPNGEELAYQITLKGGKLDNCTVDIVEALYPRDKETWGIFDVAGKVNCSDGGFVYASSGAWDSNGFHAAGRIQDGSGTGSFRGITGRVAELGGKTVRAPDGSLNVSYELVIEK